MESLESGESSESSEPAEQPAEFKGPAEDSNDLSAYSWLESIEEGQPAAGEAPDQPTPEPETVAPPPESTGTAELNGVIPLPISTTAEVTTSGALDDAKVRAVQLVDELRELIPRLSASAGPETGTIQDVIGSLNEALQHQGSDAERFQSLRAAVATAQARPRDVDVMLDLVSRAETIAAVLAAHDRYVAAIESAVSTLEGGGPEPAPRW
jgi:hypothetical protein